MKPCPDTFPFPLVALDETASTNQYHGRLLAYIQTTGGEGPVKVKFASPLLKGTEVKFEVGQ